MYRALLDGKTLFDTSLPALGVTAGRLSLCPDKPESAEFTLPPGHPGQTMLTGGAQRLTILRGDTVLFRGRPSGKELDVYGNMTVTAQGAAGYLEDAEFAVSGGVWTRTAAAVDSLLALCRGVCTGFPLLRGTIDEVEGVCCDVPAGTTTGLALMDTLRKALGGHVFIRGEGDALYLDWLAEDSLPLCAQTVTAGVNLLKLSYSVSAPEVTELYPLAKDGSGNVLTISPVSPDGSVLLRNTVSAARHGIRRRQKDFGTLPDARSLYCTAKEYFAAVSADTVSVTAQAADLMDTGEDTEPLRVGCRVRLCVPRLGIDLTAPVTAQSMDLCDPASNRVTLGAARPGIIDKGG